MNGILFLLTIAAIGVATMMAIGAMYMILTNFTPGQSKVAQDVEKMKSEIQPWIDELIPWKSRELDLLSFNNINKQIKKGIVKTAKGVLTSIYQEPLVAYSFKQYFGKTKNAVLYAQTADRAFEYRIREDHVAVSVDNQPLGTIDPDGRFYAASGNRLTARINRHADELTLPIIVKDREVAAMIKKSQAGSISSTTRAFEFVNPVQESEEEPVLALTLWEVLKDEVPLPVKVEEVVV